MWHRPQRLAGLVLVLGAFACSLVVDTSELDQGCGTGKKFCGDACVNVSDPSYGCSDNACTPCPKGTFTDRFVPKCDEGRCAVDHCLYGYGCDDCSARILTDPLNCGGCRVECGSGRTCSEGSCVDSLGSAGAGGQGGESG